MILRFLCRALAGLCVAALLGPAVSFAADTPVLKRVLLSTGGVGYFEFEAKVSGNAELSLPVRVDQIDDILKSLVIFDSKGGTGQVSLPSRLPESEILRDLPINAMNVATPADILRALTGTEIDVSGPRSVMGRIVGVAEETMTDKNGRASTLHRVSVLGRRGLESFVFEEARSISFKDRKFQETFERALTDLAKRGSETGRSLTITSRGSGSRVLTIGYVAAAPLWKSAYRLVLPPAAPSADPPKGRLQGWAILENASGLDWKSVELTLVSGNPVTFRQALYDAYYVDRPEVPVEVFGRVLPKPDQGGIAYDGAMASGRTAMDKAEMDSMYAAEPGMGGGGGGYPPPPSPTPMPESIIVTAQKRAATSEEATTQVVFRLNDPVTVGRGQSLAVPIIDRLLPVSRIALIDREDSGDRPLAAAKLVNDSDSGLPPGVLTLYEGSARGNLYVGDARLMPLPAKQSRLVSYAVDEKTLIKTDDLSGQRIEKGKISGGMLDISVVEQETADYTVAAPQSEPRDLIVAHPRYYADEVLVTPKGKDIEISGNAFRIPFHVDAGATATLRVTTERPVAQTLALVDLSTDRIEAYLSAKQISPELAQIFKELAGLRAPMDEADQKIRALASERDRIYGDQERLRKNIEVLKEQSALKRRYLDQMNEQEDRLTEIRNATRTAEAAKDKAFKALKAYVETLEL